MDFPEVGVDGFPHHPELPACDLYFQWYHPTDGWLRYLPEVAKYPVGPGEADRGLLLPAHHQRAAGPPPCGNGPVDPPPVAWRIVDGDGAVVTTFDGPWAVDAEPLAERLDVLERHRAGRTAPPTCVPGDGHECWTALELWVFLVEWQRARCPSLDPLPGDKLDELITAAHADGAAFAPPAPAGTPRP